jgi:hypothetical protein
LTAPWPPLTAYCLFVPVGDSPARQIIGRHFNAYTVAYQYADSVFAHLTGNRCQYDVLGVIELNFEKRIGLFVDDCALRWNQIVSCQ